MTTTNTNTSPARVRLEQLLREGRLSRREHATLAAKLDSARTRCANAGITSRADFDRADPDVMQEIVNIGREYKAAYERTLELSRQRQEDGWYLTRDGEWHLVEGYWRSEREQAQLARLDHAREQRAKNDAAA